MEIKNTKITASKFGRAEPFYPKGGPKGGQKGVQKGVQNQNFTPDPGPSPKCREYYLEYPWFFLAPELLEIHFLAGISTQVHPAHLGTSLQKLSVQGCLNICN